MKIFPLPLFLLLTLLSFSSCKKKDVKPGEQLPAATMEGKNSFGAMVNREVWVPKGRPSTLETNLDVVYDPNYAGGSFDIRAFRKTKNDPFMFESMALGMTQVNRVGVYYWGKPDPEQHGSAFFYSETCDYLNDPEVYRVGKMEITKLDMKNGIIAGTFEFTVAKPGCDTIRVTEGRFDKKLL
ncbi:hypothetical protein DXT99_20145 [Pontibacter diazotrophicus]|uniref:Uncharacterized protein n=1 Tax=Pontibacter diazotrophicus TaxID=1400979 RepID=A0A3D8L8L5_9BACT|nr:hypothetical protein [Pontibacter diazotrophicus]RDV13332.1 hypothetical protein DXT99_20145 [Pontibacter diazotrophicus]